MKVIYNYIRDCYNKPYAVICALENDDKELMAMGVSLCSEKDQFTKKIGRNIAYGRALKNLNNGQIFTQINLKNKRNLNWCLDQILPEEMLPRNVVRFLEFINFKVLTDEELINGVCN